ncbi:MAG: TonB-dependent receptor domain-containing protein [Rufibacter sp.]
MAHRILFSVFLWAVALCSLQSYAQAPDSVALQEIRVTGHKYTRYAAGARVQTVDSLLLQRQPGITLADALQQRSPLYFKSYGNGMTATVTFRGTTAGHTAVLWNGFNLALPTLGLSDFALLPPPVNTQVSLQHGPSGALHGSGSIGGAVILDNPVSFQPRQLVRVQQEWGSFGHSRSAASGTFSDGRLALASSFTRTAADNNFKFQNTASFGKPWEVQQNAAFDQNSFAQEIHYKLTEEQQISLRGWYVKTHRQIQPAMGSANTHAVQDDENLRLMAEWLGQVAQGTTTVRGAWFKDRLDYQDDGTVSLSTVNTYQGQVEHERRLWPKVLLQVGAEGQLFKANVGGYGGKVAEQRFSGYGWLRYDPLPRLQLSLNVRQAWVQGFNPPVTPTLGANFTLWQAEENTLTLKGNVSRSYRVPTLNDRFWSPGGNPNLQPENGWGYEGGLQHRFAKGKLSGTSEFTAYRLKVEDWIQWQPSATGGYSEPVNLSQVRGHGTELDSRWQLSANQDMTLLGGVAYAYTISEQKLPNAQAQLQDRQLFYVPKHKAAVWADIRYQGWWLTADATFTSLRYSDNDNNNWLPGYALANAGIGKPCPGSLLKPRLWLRCSTSPTLCTKPWRTGPCRPAISGCHWLCNGKNNNHFFNFTMNLAFLKKPLLAAVLAGSTFLISSCDGDEDTTPKGAYEHGVFITNEGNFGTPTAEVSFLSPDAKTFIPELFDQVNNRPLGDAAQSMTFVDDKAYIVLNASEKIEVVNAYTFASVGVINGLKIPRYMVALNANKAYVTEYVGYSFSGYTGTGRVSVLDLTKNTVTKTIDVGLLPEGLLLHNGKLYVANSSGNTVSVINTTTDVVEKEITVGESPKHLVLDANNKIWVLRGGWSDPGALVKIDPANNHALTTYPFAPGTSSAGYLTMNGSKNTLYYTYNSQVYTMPISARPAPTTPLINRNAYGLGVDPQSNTLYLGIGGYTSNGWAIRYQPNGTRIDSFQVRILPNGFTFR